jgi:hypothetical protein
VLETTATLGTFRDVSNALAGLLGVLLGAAISTGSNWFIETRRARRADERETKANERQLTQAIRLIDDEIQDIGSSLCIAIDHYEWWPRSSFVLPSKRWDEYGPVLAGSEAVTSEDWMGISVVYQEIRDLSSRLASAETKSDINYLYFDESSHRFLNGLLGAVNEARWRLSIIDGTPRSDIAPDIVSGMANAAIRAAANLYGQDSPRCQFKIMAGADFIVQAGFEVDALAIYDLPDCLAFKVTLPVGVTIKAMGGAPTGSAGFAGRIVDSTHDDDALVPGFLREDAKYSGYVLIVPTVEIEGRLDFPPF